MLSNPSVLTDIKAIISTSKDRAIRMVDHERTLMYWCIGQRIFDEEQLGKDRADYGSYLIKYIGKLVSAFVSSSLRQRYNKDGLMSSSFRQHT